MADSDILSTPISKLSLTNTPPVSNHQDGLPMLETRSGKAPLEHPTYEDLMKDAKVVNSDPTPVASNNGSYNEQLLDLQTTKDHHLTHQPNYTYSMAPIPNFNNQQPPAEPMHGAPHMPSYPLMQETMSKPSTSQAIRGALWNHRHTLAVILLFFVVIIFGVPKMLQYLPKFSNSGTLQPKLTTKGTVLLSCITGGLYYSLDSFVLHE
jgi:hypothetical protein